MRAAYQSGEVTQQELADRFAVSRGNVSKIVNGESYQEVA
jgi:DNA-binding MarR family transcriptional regulator